jgi:hypothetical protein
MNPPRPDCRYAVDDLVLRVILLYVLHILGAATIHRVGGNELSLMTVTALRKAAEHQANVHPRTRTGTAGVYGR